MAGILITAKNADFSAAPVGHVGLTTSVTSGLRMLHELRRSSGKALNNSATGEHEGSVVGAPAFTDNTFLSTLGNSLNFDKRPTGQLTMACIVKTVNGGTISEMLGAFGSAGVATTQGYAYFNVYNYAANLVAGSWPAGDTPPLASYTQKTASINIPVGQRDRFDLFIGVLENNVSARIRCPRLSLSGSQEAVGRDFAFDAPATYAATTTAGVTREYAMFAEWNRVLSVPEQDTFYAEMKEQYARLGLAI